MNTVMAACTGIQNRCSGTPVPRWMIAKDDGGEALQIGTTTMCSKSPPPKAAAIEKQRKTNDHSATYIGEKIGAHGTLLGQQLLAVWAVVAHCGRVDQNLGTR